MNKTKPAVFLDRDGTLIVEVGYISKVEDLKLIDGTAESIKKLNENKIPAILVTNQSGVARGYFDEENVKKLNQALAKELKKSNAYIDAYYYCPHHKKGTIEKYAIDCDCRKPKPGMIYQAVKDFKDIDLNNSYVVGDKMCDVELGKNAGCKGILLKTGYGSQVIEESGHNFVQPDYIAEDIKDAIDWILEDLNK